MNNKTLILGGIALILVLGFVAVLAATIGLGSLFIITRSGGGQPTPVVYEEVLTTDTYQPVLIDEVKVEVGIGSPRPIHVLIDGTLPDTCAQVEYVEQKQAGPDFIITVSAIPSQAEGCIQDKLPFKMAIPLMSVGMEAGTHAVIVNGARASFKLDQGLESHGSGTAGMEVVKDDIQVNGVNVEFGVGSPKPVKAIITGNLPAACAQLGEVRMHREGTTFFVLLVAYLPAGTGCARDSLPFRLEIPLNIVNLPEGEYEMNVNGMEVGFGWGSGTAAAVPDDPGASINGCGMPVEVPVMDGRVSYKGISFYLDPTIASSLAAQECPASGQENSMGTGAHPAYIAFTFPGYAPLPMQYPPELRVYEVSGNMSGYTYPLNSLDELGMILDLKTEAASWYSAAPLHARQATLDFASGAGVRGLVQYMQDPFFYTNNGLTYEFNGLTGDGTRFVLLRYPVRVPFLMELEGPDPLTNSNPQAIAVPGWPSDYEQQRRIIEAYNAEARVRLEGMQDSELLPGLAALDALVRSLRVGEP